MNNDRDAQVYLKPVRKFIVGRMSRTKQLLQNCMPDAWKRAQHCRRKQYHSRETQTSPVKMTQADSFDKFNTHLSTMSSTITSPPYYDKLPNKDTISIEAFESGSSVDSSEQPDIFPRDDTLRTGMGCFQSVSKTGSCSFLHLPVDGYNSPEASHNTSLLEKIEELKSEMRVFRSTLCSLQPVAIPPPPPPPPPAVPLLSPTDLFQQSGQLPLRRYESSLVVSNGVFSQDDGKPFVTVEELQKVKLRKISSFSKDDKSVHYELHQNICEECKT